MRKLLILSSLVLVLSACGLKSSSDFTSLYNDHVHSEIVAVEELVKSLGLYKQEQSVGMLQATVNVPVLMSGSLSLEHDAKVNGRDADLMLKNIRLAYESMMGSGSMTLEKLGLVSKSGDAYFLFAGLKDENLLSEEIRTLMNTYANTWLSWTQEDMQKTLSGASNEEILSNAIIENISKMTLSDVEKYLKKYPIFKDTADLGMSGSLHTYAVELDREMVLDLVSQVAKDLTGSGLSDTDKKDIQDGLAALVFSGTLGFDPSDARVAQAHLVISESGSAVIGVLDIMTSKNLTQIQLTSANSNTSASLVFEKKENRNEIRMTVAENGAELGKLSGYIENDGEKFKELALDVMAQGITVSMKHTMKDDGKFEGNLQLPIGNITWNGVFTGKKLTALTLKGTMPMGSVSMELVPEGDKIVGPLVVKEGSNELFHANVGLLVDDGKFGLGLDVMTPESKEPQARIELNITSKSSPFTSSVGIPSPSKPLQGLIDELEKLAPADSFAPVDQVDMSTVDMSDDGEMISPDAIDFSDSVKQ